jgi:adenylate cyclase
MEAKTQAQAQKNEELWWSLLTGENSKLRRERRFFGLFPTPDTQNARCCKMCLVPFEGITAPFMRRLVGRRRWERFPCYCNACENKLRANPGGVEIDVFLIFADVRGSANLAAKMRSSEYIRLMQRFYATATRILIKSNAYIDKLIGDEVMAIYLPAMSGTHGARDAVFAARELLIATGHVGEPWIPIGIGVHTGPAFVGSVGSESGIYDMTALGDTVNIAARFASVAERGEIVMSTPTCLASSIDWTTEKKHLQLKGIGSAIEAHVFRAGA